jgi:hypothetical protein
MNKILVILGILVLFGTMLAVAGCDSQSLEPNNSGSSNINSSGHDTGTGSDDTGTSQNALDLYQDENKKIVEPI